MPTPVSNDAVTVRHLAEPNDYEQAVALQRRTWGPDFDDVISGVTLKIAQKIGGIAAGAFVDRELIGVVFGLLGLLDGQLVHWSHMLAVRPDARDRGVGRALKIFQRETTLQQNIDTMLWTFEPLESRNANLNVNRLGAQIRRYERDAYGSGSLSPLFDGIGTDRLVVQWNMRSTRVIRAIGGGFTFPTDETAPVVNPDENTSEADIVAAVHDDRLQQLRIQIPGDIQNLKQTDLSRALRWRSTVRLAFESTLAEGFLVETFRYDRATDRGFYHLTRA